MRWSCSAWYVLCDSTSTSRRSLFSLSWLQMRSLLSSASDTFLSAAACASRSRCSVAACAFSSSCLVVLICASFEET